MSAVSDFNIRTDSGRKQTVRIIYRDEHLIAVDKPPGLRVIPDRWIPSLPNLRDLLSRRLSDSSGGERPGLRVVHRIDADTSGLVLFACTAEVHRRLSLAFENREVEKTYLAIVKGRVEPGEGEINLPLAAHPRRKGRVRVHSEGKPSLTRYKVLEQFQGYALLEVSPQTGRMHQIRVHLQAIGHSLAVDPLYDGAERLGIRSLKFGVSEREDDRERFLLSRLSLHAWRLRFTHPVSGKPLQLEAEPPRDFRALLKALRKWRKDRR